MVTSRSAQYHPGLTYILNFWHSGTPALRAERRSAQMSEIKNEDYTWRVKFNQLTSLPFKGLKRIFCLKYGPFGSSVCMFAACAPWWIHG